MKNFNLTNNPGEFLDKKRLRMDYPADHLVRTIFKSGYHSQFHKQLKKIIRNDSYSKDLFYQLPEDIQNEIDSYFQSTGKIPEWADEKLIQIGQEVFSKYVPLIMVLLQYKSLPLCYSCKNGAKILYLTGRLTERYGSSKIFGRLIETAQMVVNTMSPGGFSSQGKGIISQQKVRIIHATVRHFIKSPKHNKYGWDTEELGEPINQEDLTGTLMSFASVIIDGLQKLNIQLTEEERLGYMHCWKIIGHFTGIDHDLLPDTYEEGWELAIQILKHQAAPSEEGMILTRSCIDLHKKLTGGILFKDMPEFMVRYFLQEISEASGLDIGEMVGAKSETSDYQKMILLFSKLAAIGTLNKTFLKGYHKFDDITKKVNLKYRYR